MAFAIGGRGTGLPCGASAGERNAMQLSPSLGLVGWGSGQLVGGHGPLFQGFLSPSVLYDEIPPRGVQLNVMASLYAARRVHSTVSRP